MFKAVISYEFTDLDALVCVFSAFFFLEIPKLVLRMVKITLEV